MCGCEWVLVSLFKHTNTHTGPCARAIVRLWRSEDILLESVPSSHHVGPEEQTQVGRLDYKWLSPLSHV